VVLYDPDTAAEFVSCFDLTGNPNPEDTWVADELPSDQSVRENGYTFADFAATQPEFKNEFSVPGPDLQADSLVPLTDYIQWSRRQRIGKYPVVTFLDSKGEKHKCIASQGIVTQTCDQIHLWKTLQELAGINNPHVQTTRTNLNAEFGVQQKALLESLQEEMEQKQTRNEREMVAGTVRKIVSHLTGVDPAQINLD
jgi:hypothetical protein